MDNIEAIIEQALFEVDKCDLIKIPADHKNLLGDKWKYIEAIARQIAALQHGETIGELFARAKKRPDLVFPPEFYESQPPTQRGRE